MINSPFLWWLCKLPGLNAIYRQGGADSFIHARQDVLDTFIGDVEARAGELAKDKLNALLSAIDERKVISFNSREKSVYIGGERVSDPKILTNLKAEADALVNFDLWQVLSETPKKLAQKALFEDDGKSEILHAKGRSMLYLLDTQKNIIATLRSYGK